MGKGVNSCQYGSQVYPAGTVTGSDRLGDRAAGRIRDRFDGIPGLRGWVVREVVSRTALHIK